MLKRVKDTYEPDVPTGAMVFVGLSETGNNVQCQTMEGQVRSVILRQDLMGVVLTPCTDSTAGVLMGGVDDEGVLQSGGWHTSTDFRAKKQTHTLLRAFEWQQTDHKLPYLVLFREVYLESDTLTSADVLADVDSLLQAVSVVGQEVRDYTRQVLLGEGAEGGRGKKGILGEIGI